MVLDLALPPDAMDGSTAWGMKKGDAREGRGRPVSARYIFALMAMKKERPMMS